MDGRLARGIARRRTIVDAAAPLFARHGFAGVTVDQIAQAAGVSGPGVYRHFAGKADVLAAVIAPAADVLFAPLATDGGPEARLRAFFDQLAGAMLEHRDAVVLAHREWPNLPAVDREKFRRALVRRSSELTALLRQWRPSVSDGDARAAVDVAIAVSAHVGNPGTAPIAERRARGLLPELSMAVLAGVNA